MRAALRERRFRLVYQPVVRMTDRSVHHYEALLRPIPTPNVPMQNTQEFITFAEAVGLSEELDWAVLETAIEALHATVDTSVAVNMSGLSMQNPAYRKRLLDRLSALRAEGSKLAPSRLLIELTETAEIADLQAAASSMEQLRSVGVPVCLDDFGAGAAAFRYLRAFGVDFVKLDGEYVRAACKNPRDRALVASMIEIAGKSGAAVVAETIETEAEAKLMADLGVTFGQGWLFGKPGVLPGMR
jgi:EAL domain-containing protein (putative c-di-GMP-specific phosphodiesterase class I)